MRHFLNPLLLLTAALLLVPGCKKNNREHTESWRFVNAPDLHNSERFVAVWENAWEKDFDSYEAFRKSTLEKLSQDFAKIHEKYDAELFVSPGDCNSARWDDRRGKDFQKRFRSVPEYANFSDKEIILEASRLCYTALNEMIYSSGYKEFLMTVGDHELGDDPWPKNSVAPETLPVFREGFANYLTLEEPGGNSRFTESIGDAPARPVGTIYEHTSNAVQYKNVLFVTLDVFRYEGKDQVLGDQGVIRGDISGKHLGWFRQVLSEARDIPSIDHIIVQAHLPVIYPVRKYASSGMLMSDTRNNELLKTMRKYEVDLYLAGEVHENTVTKDPESDLIQFVGRGNLLSNYGIVTVKEDRLTIDNYHEEGRLLGELTIDKSGKHKEIKGSKVMTPINPDGLQIHWSFDQAVPENEILNSIRGDKAEPYRVAGMVCKLAYDNTGGFGNEYALFSVNTKTGKGLIGNAVDVTSKSALMLPAMGPMEGDFKRTVAFWMKTHSQERQLILNTVSKWGRSAQFFNMGINNGRLELALRPRVTALVEGGKKLNDGKWHHVAVTVPRRKATLQDLNFYIDGLQMDKVQYTGATTPIQTTQANWMTIAENPDGASIDILQEMNMKGFIGSLDDFCIWTRSLSADDIAALVKQARSKGKSALQMEKEDFRRIQE